MPPRPPPDFHLWLSAAPEIRRAAAEALALRASAGLDARVFITGPAVQFATRAGGDPTLAKLIDTARTQAKLEILVCVTALREHGLEEAPLARWADGRAGAAAFWLTLPRGAAPLVF